MRSSSAVLVFIALFCCQSHSYVPRLPPKTKVGSKQTSDFTKVALATFTAVTLASNVASSGVAQALDVSAGLSTGSSTIVAEKIVREGLYRDYEVDIKQEVDDARSTFKAAKETKSKKGKYTALLSVLVVGSFVIPMAQYFWYVKDDDSSDKFFGQNVPEPESKQKKKGWFK